MRDPRAGRRARGFTLIELMIVTAIVGLLATVAIPEFERLSLRARVAERRTIMVGITRAMSGLSLNLGRIPDLVGDWNPATPMTFAQHFDLTAAGWNQLSLEIEGKTYYSYRFVSSSNGTVNGNSQATLDVSAVGDLDGDGVQSAKTISYVGYGQAYQIVTETPAEGAEDQFTF